MQTIWEPSNALISNSNIVKFIHWLRKERDIHLPTDYEAIWEWSVENIDLFWQCVWEFFEIDSATPYSTVRDTQLMPKTKWFLDSRINYAKQLFNQKNDDFPAFIHLTETRPLTEVSWKELEIKVAACQQFLLNKGVKKGDVVAAFMPNTIETSILFLACSASGIIWSSCSPDFGTESILDRFGQLNPTILIACDGYVYNGKSYDKTEVVKELSSQIDSLKGVVWVSVIDAELPDISKPNYLYNDVSSSSENQKIQFVDVPFQHPIWVLYSSGTTGKPKAITHNHGGMLLEHLKYHSLQGNLKKGERFFWYSTTGWMMWNFLQASLLVGGTAVLYDGSPAYPNMNFMWELIEKARINHFGTSAPFIIANMKKRIQPSKIANLKHLISIGSTGSPLPPEAYNYILNEFEHPIWLSSISGGTDMCTAFVGATPLKKVKEGTIQCRTLGCDMVSLDDNDNPIIGEVGEMMIRQPMPCMPEFFWADKDMKRYQSSYFDNPQNYWRHGDWISIHDDGTLTIHGRSDATLNRQGVRIGTAEIYNAIDDLAFVKDAVIINIELKNGNHWMPLFIVYQSGYTHSIENQKLIKTALRNNYSPRHVPDIIYEVNDIPYTISGKKLETPIKKLFMGIDENKAVNRGALRNPEAIQQFVEIYKDWKK